MKSAREEATEFFLEIIEDFQKGNKNTIMYKKYLNDLSDQNFDALFEAMADGIVVLPYYSANIVDKDIDATDSLKVAKKLNLDIFQRIWQTDPVTDVKYLSIEKYPIINLPTTRQQQHVTKGKSVADDNSFIDSMTGQVTSASKTTRMSLPEINILTFLGLRHGVEELININGGNEQGFIDAKRELLDKGEYTLKSIRDKGYTVTSTETLKSLMAGCHFDANF